MKLTHTQAKLQAHKALAEKLRREDEARQLQHEAEMEMLRVDLNRQFQTGKGAQAIEAMLVVIASQKNEILELNEKLKAKTIALYGRQVETLTKEVLGQLALALGSTEENAYGSEPIVPIPDEVITATNSGIDSGQLETSVAAKKKAKITRGEGVGTRISSSVQRRKMMQLVSESASSCPSCHKHMRHVGFAVSEKINYIPAHFEVIEMHRQTLACQNCKQGIVTAETTAAAIDVTDAVAPSTAPANNTGGDGSEQPTIKSDAIGIVDQKPTSKSFPKVPASVPEVPPAPKWAEVSANMAICALQRTEQKKLEKSPPPDAADRVQLYSRSRVTALFLAHLIEAKCDDGLPIHRQQKQFAREGVNFPVNTLYEYWNQGLSCLDSLAKILLSRVLGSSIVGADDTRFDYLCRDEKKNIKRGHFWVFVSEGALVGCKFTKDWTAEAIEPELSTITGFTQVDDYKGYLSKRKGESEHQGLPLVLPARRLGCMMHVRRRFVRAWKGGNPLAMTPCQYISEIYKIEREAKDLGLNAQDRHRLRQEKSKPLVDALYRWIDEKEGALRPKSPLAVANQYAKQQQLYIENCFTDGRFEIDNGRTEREIRGIAVGRKNFLFSGSADAASRMAGAYALVSSCRQLGLSVRDYLADVIEQVSSGDVKIRNLHRLCPDIWGIDRGLLPAGDYLEQKVAK